VPVLGPDSYSSAVIEFGVELETFIPNACEISVGGYYSGFDVLCGVKISDGTRIAPLRHGWFLGSRQRWGYQAEISI